MAKAGPALSEGAWYGQGRETHGGVAQHAETPTTASPPQATEKWPEREELAEEMSLPVIMPFPDICFW